MAFTISRAMSADTHIVQVTTFWFKCMCERSMPSTDLYYNSYLFILPLYNHRRRKSHARKRKEPEPYYCNMRTAFLMKFVNAFYCILYWLYNKLYMVRTIIKEAISRRRGLKRSADNLWPDTWNVLFY